jgi:uncharacterized protein (TIGR03790 family)
MKKLIQFALLIFTFAPLFVHAGGDEVVVVYNSLMPESKAVAEHYAAMRHVPKSQVYGFELSTSEEISRDEFHDALQIPLAKKLEDDGIWKFGDVTFPATNGLPERVGHRVVASKIRYLVLCYGVPVKIAPDVNLHETVNPAIRTELLRNEAAVDSELAWLPLIKNDVQISGPMGNPFYTATNKMVLNPTNGILLVARLDGPSAEIASGLVDKALAAERDGLWGRAYFDARGLQPGDAYYLGDRWILTSAEVCRQFGFEVTVDTNSTTFPASFPMSQIAIYAGWYVGSVDGPFALPKVEFMPGAFAYHLHSFSAGVLRTTNSNWCGPLLAKGATCTMGCVYEPYLAATPNVAFFLQAFGNGYTFGEAAWASQPALSWQTTVIGDPLYRPFGKSPPQLHAELARRHSPLLEWSYLRIVMLDLARGLPTAQLSGFIENLPDSAKGAILTEKLAELYDLQGKPSSAIDTWQHALTLNPSPQQRIRIRLTLGEKLQVLNRPADTIDNYQKLIAEAPDYPGRPGIDEKLKMLELKPAETNAAAK